MFFLFATILTALFLTGTEFSAAGFTGQIVLTALYIPIFAAYFKKCRRTLLFIPLIAASAALHAMAFLFYISTDYIKDVNIWILAGILAAVCLPIAMGTRSRSGITALTHMAVPIFFVLVLLALFGSFSGKITEPPLIGEDLLQYIISAVSPASAVFSLYYIGGKGAKKAFPAYFAAIVLAVSFYLFDSPFFRAAAMNFCAPLLIAAQLLVIKETFLPVRDTPE